MKEDESDEAVPTRRSCAINALRSMLFKRRKLRAVVSQRVVIVFLKANLNLIQNYLFKTQKPIFSEEYHVNTKFALLDEDPVHHSFYSRVVEKNFCQREGKLIRLQTHIHTHTHTHAHTHTHSLLLSPSPSPVPYPSPSLSNKPAAIKQVAAACNLPSGVQVFSYGSRMDLLRAVVFGKPGSLYDGGVFIFDLHIPADFPRAPPEVRYVPLYRNKVNPSLHEDGKVCMSILRTSHSKCGGWQNSHTITQILACIQSGLLNNDPLSGTDFHCPVG